MEAVSTTQAGAAQVEERLCPLLSIVHGRVTCLRAGCEWWVPSPTDPSDGTCALTLLGMLAELEIREKL